jgi:hypothetical protein
MCDDGTGGFYYIYVDLRIYSVFLCFAVVCVLRFERLRIPGSQTGTTCKRVLGVLRYSEFGACTCLDTTKLWRMGIPV